MYTGVLAHCGHITRHTGVSQSVNVWHARGRDTRLTKVHNAYTYTHMQVHIHTHTQTYRYTHIHTHTLTYTHTHAHTHTYIHTHTHTLAYVMHCALRIVHCMRVSHPHTPIALTPAHQSPYQHHHVPAAHPPITTPAIATTRVH